MATNTSVALYDPQVTAGFVLHTERDRAGSISASVSTVSPRDHFADGLDVAVSLGGRRHHAAHGRQHLEAPVGAVGAAPGRMKR